MNMKPQIFIAPSKYVQGSGVIGDVGKYVAPLGDRVLVAGGKHGLRETREGREKSFGENGISQIEVEFRGETCDSEINRLAAFCVQNKCNVIMASGGGKVIDTVKSAAEDVGAATVIVPTTAANDAPCSALSVVYNDDATHGYMRPLKRNPDLVLVDTDIISRAPVRYLIAGMGDAIATWFEADACFLSGTINLPGGSISNTAMALARLCYDTLIEFGLEAKTACENKTVNTALERVVEANTLLSGLGFESGGVAVAHALSQVFSRIPEIHHCLHGEAVAFGLLVQLLLGGVPDDDLEKVFRFCNDVGLPVTLADINGDKVSRSALRDAAEAAAAPGSTTCNMPFHVTGQMLIDAIYAADAKGRSLRA